MTTDAAQQQQRKSAKPQAAEGGANYKATLNLPQTTFPMEAKLVQNEPARLARWKQNRLYEKVLRARAGAPKWVLHDGQIGRASCRERVQGSGGASTSIDK